MQLHSRWLENSKEPQISPLRFAPVEVTRLLSYIRPCIDWKNRNLPKTTLSSRPERSVVERSAVLFSSHPDSSGPTRTLAVDGTERKARILNGKEYFPLAFAGVVMSIACSGILSKSQAQAGLPEDPGRVVLERMCTSCHGLNVVTGQRMTKKGWASQVDDMVSRGAVGSSADI